LAEDFATAATRFCSVIERVGDSSRSRWLAEVEAALSEVYASAVRLPHVGPATDEPWRGMSTDEWSSLFDALLLKTGTDDGYWRILDPGDQASVVRSSLADDLADVYRALRGGVNAVRSGVAPEEVLFEWRLGFDSHWASHAVGALTALRAAQKNI
jgi:hypothetical protein